MPFMGFSKSSLYLLNNTNPNVLSGGILLSKCFKVCVVLVFHSWFFLVTVSQPGLALLGILAGFCQEENAGVVGLALIMGVSDGFKLW